VRIKMDPIVQTAITTAISKTVENGVSKIWGKIGKYFQDKKERNKIDYGNAFEIYLSRAFNKYSRARTLLWRNESRYIEDFYQNMNLELSHKIIRTNSIESLLKDIKEQKRDEHFLIISGSGGVGKSTLLKHLFIDAIKTTNYIPIFIELRDISGSTYDLETFVYQCLYNLGCKIKSCNFFYALEGGCFIFLFDGFDEVSKEPLKNSYLYS
jgi:putative protein kinase ArgK-like GTPase of G3E family